MSGSRRYFAYFSDNSDEYAIQLDESVAESTSLGFGQSITQALASNPASRIFPSRKYPLEPRYVLAQRTDGDGRTVRRKFYVGALTAPAWSGAPYGVVVDGQEWDITARVGESRYYVPAEDTGLIDGDVDSNTTSPI